MEKQIEKDFYELLEEYWEEDYGKKPNKKRKEELFQLWKTEYVGLENWEEVVNTHTECEGDRGYWFGEFCEAIGEFMWQELRIIED